MDAQFMWMTPEEGDYLDALHASLKARMQRPEWTMFDTVRWALGQVGKQFNLGSYPWPIVLKSLGKLVKPEQVPPVLEPTTIDLEFRTIAELRVMAEDRGIDLTGISRKADIIAALEADEDELSSS